MSMAEYQLDRLIEAEAEIEQLKIERDALTEKIRQLTVEAKSLDGDTKNQLDLLK